MNIEGKITVIDDTVKISDKFKKRSFVIEHIANPERAEYVEYIQLEMTQDNCDKLNGVKIGDSVNVEFNLRGRKWTPESGETKYFNTLQAWKIDVNGVSQENEYKTEPNLNPHPSGQKEGAIDDIPF